VEEPVPVDQVVEVAAKIPAPLPAPRIIHGVDNGFPVLDPPQHLPVFQQSKGILEGRLREALVVDDATA
jgi:hypothetical protein